MARWSSAFWIPPQRAAFTAALEVLAIIAYNQPVSRSFINRCAA
ncbi:MAG: SMC-Scp complex subunit ScpB [Gemmiger sp.]